MNIPRRLSIALFLSVCSLCSAQYALPKYKDIAALKDRQLIIIVNPPNPDVVNKFERRGKPIVLQTYNQVIGNYNDVMKYAAKTFWNFNSKEVLFKTRDELSDLFKDKSNYDKYFFIYFYSEGNGYKRDLDWTINGDGDKITGTHTYFSIGFPGEYPFYTVYLADLIPSAVMITYLISNANYKFNYVLNHPDELNEVDMIDNNAHKLSHKILLISQKDVEPDFINEIGTYYPCSYKVVSDSEMTELVASADTSYAYVIRSYGSTGVVHLGGGLPIG